MGSDWIEEEKCKNKCETKKTIIRIYEREREYAFVTKMK
jgi:hypothetical protein